MGAMKKAAACTETISNRKWNYEWNPFSLKHLRLPPKNIMENSKRAFEKWLLHGTHTQNISRNTEKYRFGCTWKKRKGYMYGSVAWQLFSDFQWEGLLDSPVWGWGKPGHVFSHTESCGSRNLEKDYALRINICALFTITGQNRFDSQLLLFST